MKQEQKTHVSADALIQLLKGAKAIRWQLALGVVGIVYLTSDHYSVVIPVLSSKSNISCAIRGRGYFGYLHWYGNRPDDHFGTTIPGRNDVR